MNTATNYLGALAFNYYFIALWAGVVIFALGRLGTVLAPYFRFENADFGLRMGLGLVAMTTYGGLLVLFRISYGPVMIASVLAIAGYGLYRWIRQRSYRALFSNRGDVGLMVASFIVCAAAILIYVFEPSYFTYDDMLGYFDTIRKIVVNGHLIEPFSYRRLLSMGGQTFMQALTVAPTATDSAYVLFEKGISFVLLFANLMGFVRESTSSLTARASLVVRWIAFAVFTYFSLFFNNDYIINTGGTIAALPLVILFFRFLDARSDSFLVNSRDQMLIGLTAGVIVSFRAQMIVFVVGQLGLFFLFSSGRPLLDRLVAGFKTLGYFLLALLPWCIVLYQSNHTFFFPIMFGDYNAAVDVNRHPLNYRFHDYYLAVRTLFQAPHVRMMFTAATALVTLLVITCRTKRALFLSLLIASLVTTVFLVFNSPLWVPAIPRYLFPFLVAVWIFCSIYAVVKPRWFRPLQLLVLVLAIVPFHILSSVRANQDRFRAYRDRVVANLKQPALPAFLPPEAREEYRVIQSLVPKGERILVVDDLPYAFDYGRNDILNVDVPGFVHPGHAMPFFRGPEALRAYLLEHGVRYVIQVISEQSGYIFFNTNILEQSLKTMPPDFWDRVPQMHYLDLLRNLQLMRSVPGVDSAHSNHFWIIRL